LKKNIENSKKVMFTQEEENWQNHFNTIKLN
jgi:hypothetical protein